MDIRLIFLNRRDLYTVHGEIFEADSWYVSVQPSGNAKGVRVTHCVTILEKALARKADVRVVMSARTANQHRCSSRVDSGLRENLR